MTDIIGRVRIGTLVDKLSELPAEEIINRLSARQRQRDTRGYTGLCKGRGSA